jgi:pimeloyl-ACP methyl ester carboxylesterase
VAGPKQFLLFTRTAGGRRAGKEFLARLEEGTHDRDKAISLTSYGAQLKAIHRWRLEQPHDLSVIHKPVLVANGESDRMVPSQNSADLARRVPNGELVIYLDARSRRHLPVPPTVRADGSGVPRTVVGVECGRRMRRGCRLRAVAPRV